MLKVLTFKLIPQYVSYCVEKASLKLRFLFRAFLKVQTPSMFEYYHPPHPSQQILKFPPLITRMGINCRAEDN